MGRDPQALAAQVAASMFAADRGTREFMKQFPLEPIETASVDELRSLQFKRLRIELRPAGGIERSLGKAWRVLDQRKL